MICKEIEPASRNGHMRSMSQESMSSMCEEGMRRSHMCLDCYRSLTSILQCPHRAPRR
jgi:ribosomal protein L37AE/L43A